MPALRSAIIVRGIGVGLLLLPVLMVIVSFPRGRMMNVAIASGRLSNLDSSFVALGAEFAPLVRRELTGILRLAQPVDACLPVTEPPDMDDGNTRQLLLVGDGGCNFEVKVRNVQAAGYAAAIVFNNVRHSPLISMKGNSTGIRIPAAFISREDGQKAMDKGINRRCELEAGWFYGVKVVLRMILFSWVVFMAVLGVMYCIFGRMRGPNDLGDGRLNDIEIAHTITNARKRLSISRVDELCPATVYKQADESLESCCICLDDYEKGDTVRSLPCHHVFHAVCIEEWLTTQQPLCPVCKLDLT